VAELSRAKPGASPELSADRKALLDASAINKLESVADMLEEAHQAIAAAKTAPVESPAASPAESVAAAAPASAAAASPEASAGKPAEDAKLSAAQQIEKAEHEIDNLLSVSLIRPENTSTHRRLPEVAVPPRPEEDTGVDLELNAGRPMPAPAEAPRYNAEHHGLKVIQPLEPIVSAKERFARELAALNGGGDQTSQAASSSSQGAPAASAAAPAAASASSAASASKAPTPPTAPPAPIVKTLEMTAAPSAPEAAPSAAVQSTPSFDDSLPVAESLAAEDVAKAKAEQAKQAASAPASEPTTAPVVAAAAEAVAAKAEPKHKRSKREKRELEHIETTEEAEHNKPTEAEAEAGQLTGKLIMPSAEKPKPEPVTPKAEKPKKLAPGEVFVDENGNVIIGE
jgi:hypothetical protein